MSRIEQLYQEMILEHNRNPRNFKVLEPCTHSSHGINPLCGDDYHLYLTINEGQITDLGFMGKGCAISKSSGSLMTAVLKGKSIEEAQKLKITFLNMLTDSTTDGGAELSAKLKVFEGVKKFPIRVKCATLIWHALEDALNQAGTGKVSTES